MFDDFTPGQTLRCTVTKRPTREDTWQTIERLMRQDPDIRRRLRKSQLHRARTTPSKIRGGRVWMQRVKASKHAVPNEGATWEMPFIPHLVRDIESVSGFIKVEAA